MSFSTSEKDKTLSASAPEKKFRPRGRNYQMWNPEVPKGKEVSSWKQALKFVHMIKAREVVAYRIQVNLKSHDAIAEERKSGKLGAKK